MKKNIKHTMLIPLELDMAIQKKRIERFEKEKTYPSFTEILIELAFASLNGNSPPSVPNSHQESVSTPTEDTDLKQPKESPLSFDGVNFDD